MPVPPVIPVPASVAKVFASRDAKPAELILACVVNAPVVVLLLTDVNPPSDRTGPEKVELPMFISLSWQMSVTPCNCQGSLSIHKKKRATRAALNYLGLKEILSAGGTEHTTPV